MQGDPLAIIAYGIGIIPLFNYLKREIHGFTQPNYANNARAYDMFARLETYFYSLTCLGPVRDYHRKLTKSVLLILPENIETGKLFGRRHRFRVCMGARYLGGYIGGDKSKHDWLRERTLTWENNINTIRETTGKYTQESYAAIKSEWIFIQCSTWDIGNTLVGMEKMNQ